ncbi:MAG: amidohydrolase family protein [Acidimicrobiia bacterium]
MSNITSPLVIDERIGYALFDADQHYYEPEDALTRYLPSQYKRLVRWVDIDGRRRLILDGHVFSKMANASYNPIAKPGALSEMFKGNNPEGKSAAELLGEEEPTRREYRNREARLAELDRQGVEGCLMLPSFGLYVEEQFKTNPEALVAILTAYNRWLLEDWGFNYENRIFTGPLLSFIDPEFAVSEITWAHSKGAKFIVLRPSPVTDGVHHWSLGDARHDVIWSKLTELGMFAVFHAADSGYDADSARWGESKLGSFYSGALIELMATQYERPIEESIAALVAHNVFHRHPKLKVATIELGSKWASSLYARAKSTYAKMPQVFTADPVEVLREHVYISPFYEDNLSTLKELAGADRIMLGSDWPHPEGLVTPGDYIEHLAEFNAAEVRKVMADNLKGLLGL